MTFGLGKMLNKRPPAKGASDKLPQFLEANRPHWSINNSGMKLEIVGQGKVMRAFNIPPVVNAYKGDTRERVLAEEVEKLKEQYHHTFGQILRAWELAQALTEQDKFYIRAHQAWRIAATEKGINHPNVVRMYAALELPSHFVTPAGWQALGALTSKVPK